MCYRLPAQARSNIVQVYTKAQARVPVDALVANFSANESSLADVPEAQIEDN